jgi:hypothetical protein
MAMTTEMKMDWLVKSGNSDVAIGYWSYCSWSGIDHYHQAKHLTQYTPNTHTKDGQPTCLSFGYASEQQRYCKGTVPK